MKGAAGLGPHSWSHLARHICKRLHNNGQTPKNLLGSRKALPKPPLLLVWFQWLNRLHSKMLISSFLISGPPLFNLVFAHVFTPNDCVAANEVVRAARKIPLPTDGNGVTVSPSNVNCQPTGLIGVTTFKAHPQKQLWTAVP